MINNKDVNCDHVGKEVDKIRKILRDLFYHRNPDQLEFAYDDIGTIHANEAFLEDRDELKALREARLAYVKSYQYKYEYRGYFVLSSPEHEAYESIKKNYFDNDKSLLPGRKQAPGYKYLSKSHDCLNQGHYYYYNKKSRKLNCDYCGNVIDSIGDGEPIDHYPSACQMNGELCILDRTRSDTLACKNCGGRIGAMSL